MWRSYFRLRGKRVRREEKQSWRMACPGVWEHTTFLPKPAVMGPGRMPDVGNMSLEEARKSLTKPDKL